MQTNLLVKGLLLTSMFLFGGVKRADAVVWTIGFAKIENTTFATVDGKKVLSFQGLDNRYQSASFYLVLKNTYANSSNLECVSLIERAHDSKDESINLSLTVEGPDRNSIWLTNVKQCQLAK